MRAGGAVGAGADRVLLVTVVIVIIQAEIQSILFWRGSPESIQHRAVLNDTNFKTVFNLNEL